MKGLENICVVKNIRQENQCRQKQCHDGKTDSLIIQVIEGLDGSLRRGDGIFELKEGILDIYFGDKYTTRTKL